MSGMGGDVEEADAQWHLVLEVSAVMPLKPKSVWVVWMPLLADLADELYNLLWVFCFSRSAKSKRPVTGAMRSMFGLFFSSRPRSSSCRDNGCEDVGG